MKQAVFFASLWFALQSSGKPADPLKPLEGNWIAIQWEVDGEQAGLAKREIRLIVEGDRFALKADGKRTDHGSFVLNDKKKPRVIDIRHLGEEFKNEISLGIYELKKEELWLCLARAGEKERPIDFSCKKGSEHVLMIFVSATDYKSNRKLSARSRNWVERSCEIRKTVEIRWLKSI